jgi:hypothetical protein
MHICDLERLPNSAESIKEAVDALGQKGLDAYARRSHTKTLLHSEGHNCA